MLACPAWLSAGKGVPSLQAVTQRGRLPQGDSIRVRMSPNPVPTINNADMVRPPCARLCTSNVHVQSVAAQHQRACCAAQPCGKPPHTPHSSGKHSRLSNVSCSCSPVQTTDWFTSIQRCFQWSERIEQLPMDQVRAGCQA